MVVEVRSDDRYGAWKALHFNAVELADPAISGDHADPDGDDFTNQSEYVAGTDPRNGGSYLAVETELTETSIILRFETAADRSYSIQYRDNVDSGEWFRVRDIDAAPAPRPVAVELQNSPGRLTRYYRLVTPRL